MRKLELSTRLGLALGLVWLSSSCTSLSKQAPPFRPPPVQTKQLSNGLTMMVLKDASLPRFQLSLVMKMGSRLDPKGLEGLNHLFFSLLDQGTKTRSAEKIAQELNQFGTEISQGAGTDSSFVSVAGLKVFQNSILEVFSDVIFHPSFEPAEVDRVRRLNLSALQKLLDSPPSYASAKMDELLYQNHPYARSSVGSSESLSKIGRSQLLDYFENQFRPQRAYLLVTGAVEDAFLTKLENIFSRWSPGRDDSYRLAIQLQPQPRAVLLDKSDLQQSQIRVAALGVPRGHPDERALALGAFVLGGGFSSRLNDRIRDDMGLTYGISASLDSGLEVGSLEISTFSRFEKTSLAIQEVRKMLGQWIQKGVTSKELAGAKSLLLGQYPAGLQTAEQITQRLVNLRMMGLPDSDLYQYPERIREISVDQVNAALKRHFKPENFSVLVFADARQVAESLKSSGYDFEILPAKPF